MLGGAIASGLEIRAWYVRKNAARRGRVLRLLHQLGNGWAYLIGLFVGAAFIGLSHHYSLTQ